MRQLVLVGLVYLAFAAQPASADLLGLGASTPDLLVTMFVVATLSSRPGEAICFAALVGFLRDCVGMGRLGVDLAVFAALAAAATPWRDGILARSIAPRTVTAATLVFAAVALSSIGHAFVAGRPIQLHDVSLQASRQAIDVGLVISLALIGWRWTTALARRLNFKTERRISMTQS